MAFTRKFLLALKVPEEAIDEIISAHTDVTDGLIADRDKYKKDADLLPDVQKQLDDMKRAGTDGFKDKYESEHAAFEKFKGDVEAEKANSEKSALYTGLLKKLGVDEKRIPAILKVTDLAKVVVKDGNIDKSDELEKSIKSEWSGFIVDNKASGASVENPPAGGGEGEADLGAMSMKDYIAARKKA